MKKCADLICERLHSLCDSSTRVAHDIEGWADKGVSVCSFAWSATEALSVPLRHLNWTPWWGAEEEAAIMAALKRLLEDATVPKLAHNFAYEGFVWAWSSGIKIRGIGGDTMLKAATLFPELDKALDVCASIYTREPFWKHLGDTDDDETLARYNALDAMICFECDAAMEPLLEPGQRQYYQTQLALLEPTLSMMLQGIAYDQEARSAMLAQVQREIYEAQGALDTLAGIAPPEFDEVAETVCFKRSLDKVKTWDDVLLHCKPTMKESL